MELWGFEKSEKNNKSDLYSLLQQTSPAPPSAGPGPDQVAQRSCYPLPPDSGSNPSASSFARPTNPQNVEGPAQEFGVDSRRYQSVYAVGVTTDNSQYCFVPENQWQSSGLQYFTPDTWRRVLQATNNFSYITSSRPQNPVQPWGIYRRNINGQAAIYVYGHHPVLLNLCNPDFPANSAYRDPQGFETLPLEDVVAFPEIMARIDRGNALDRLVNRMLGRRVPDNEGATLASRYCVTMPDPVTGTRTMGFAGDAQHSVDFLLPLLEHVEDPHGYSATGAYVIALHLPGFAHRGLHLGIGDPRAYAYATGLRDYLDTQLNARDMFSFTAWMSGLTVVASSIFAARAGRDMFRIRNTYEDVTGSLIRNRDALVSSLENNPYQRNVYDQATAGLRDFRSPHIAVSAASGGAKGLTLPPIFSAFVNGEVGPQLPDWVRAWDRFLAERIQPFVTNSLPPSLSRVIGRFVPDLFLGHRVISIDKNRITLEAKSWSSGGPTIIAMLIDNMSSRWGRGNTIFHLEESSDLVKFGEGTSPANLLSAFLTVANRASRAYARINIALDSSKMITVLTDPGSRDLKRRINLVEYTPPLIEHIAPFVRAITRLNQTSTEHHDGTVSNYRRAMIDGDVYETLAYLAEGHTGKPGAPPGTALDLLTRTISDRIGEEGRAYRGDVSRRVQITRDNVLRTYLQLHPELTPRRADGSQPTLEEGLETVRQLIARRQSGEGRVAYQNQLVDAYYQNTPFRHVDQERLSPGAIAISGNNNRWSPLGVTRITTDTLRTYLHMRYSDATFLEERPFLIGRVRRFLNRNRSAEQNIDTLADQVLAKCETISRAQRANGQLVGQNGVPTEDVLREALSAVLTEMKTDSNPALGTSARRWERLENMYRSTSTRVAVALRREFGRALTRQNRSLARRHIHVSVDANAINRSFDVDLSDHNPYQAINMLEDLVDARIREARDGETITINERAVVEYHTQIVMAAQGGPYRAPDASGSTPPSAPSSTSNPLESARWRYISERVITHDELLGIHHALRRLNQQVADYFDNEVISFVQEQERDGRHEAMTLGRMLRLLGDNDGSIARTIAEEIERSGGSHTSSFDRAVIIAVARAYQVEHPNVQVNPDQIGRAVGVFVERTGGSAAREAEEARLTQVARAAEAFARGATFETAVPELGGSTSPREPTERDPERTEESPQDLSLHDSGMQAAILTMRGFIARAVALAESNEIELRIHENTIQAAIELSEGDSTRALEIFGHTLQRYSAGLARGMSVSITGDHVRRYVNYASTSTTPRTSLYSQLPSASSSPHPSGGLAIRDVASRDRGQIRYRLIESLEALYSDIDFQDPSRAGIVDRIAETLRTSCERDGVSLFDVHGRINEAAFRERIDGVVEDFVREPSRNAGSGSSAGRVERERDRIEELRDFVERRGR